MHHVDGIAVYSSGGRRCGRRHGLHVLWPDDSVSNPFSHRFCVPPTSPKANVCCRVFFFFFFLSEQLKQDGALKPELARELQSEEAEQLRLRTEANEALDASAPIGTEIRSSK